MGAVSPDYPYLAIGDRSAQEWADHMHYVKTGDMINVGVEYLRQVEGEDRLKGLSWLVGYAAHVVTDVTIHPVVELKVGPYEENKGEHRKCEMFQDSFIFQRLDLGDLGVGEIIDDFRKCSEYENDGQIDPVILNMWSHMLQTVYPDLFQQNPPDINGWHNGFQTVLDLAAEGNRLVPCARHVAANLGLSYPSPENATASEYVVSLQTPFGQRHYDKVFNTAIENVRDMWLQIENAVNSTSSSVSLAGHWNLDTGRDPNGVLVYWS
ncbi:MAG: zinc dependent phospholipase C family protein [Chitinispirillaceae bacterium]|nr:zinc dependent phospholipase C family protein [Chitinispirillaceae bacterium]